MVFQWSLSDRKSLQVTRTLLSILADLNNHVVWIVSIHPLISDSSSPLSKSLRTVPSIPITVGIIIILIFHSFFFFFSSLASTCLSFCFLWFSLYGLLGWQNPQYSKFSPFFFSFFNFSLLIITRSGHLAKIRDSVCISKSQRILCISFFRMDSGLCIYHFLLW